MLLPVLLLFILLLARDRRLMGAMVNRPIHDVLEWGTFALVVASVVLLTVVWLQG